MHKMHTEDGQHVETWCYLLEQHMVDVVYLGGDGGIPGWYAGGVGVQGVCTPARMGWLSLVTASPHLIWNTCPDTDEGAGLADAPQRTHTAWPRIYTIRVYVYVGI